MKVQFGNDVYTDGKDITNEEFYEKMKNSGHFPKTSLPSPQDFVEKFNTVDEKNSILCITISAATSGTYQSALIAKGMVNNEVEVIDSLNISMGTGLQVMRAVELINEGLSLQEIKKEILSFRHSIKTFIAIENLENVIKGGRISNWKGNIAQLLNIKPILHLVPDGSIKAIEYIRGRKRQLGKALDLIKATGKDLSHSRFVILHAKASSKELVYLEGEINRLFKPQEIIIGELGPIMGSHGGFGTIGFTF